MRSPKTAKHRTYLSEGIVASEQPLDMQLRFHCCTERRHNDKQRDMTGGRRRSRGEPTSHATIIVAPQFECQQLCTTGQTLANHSAAHVQLQEGEVFRTTPQVGKRHKNAVVARPCDGMRPSIGDMCRSTRGKLCRYRRSPGLRPTRSYSDVDGRDRKSVV